MFLFIQVCFQFFTNPWFVVRKHADRFWRNDTLEDTHYPPSEAAGHSLYTYWREAPCKDHRTRSDYKLMYHWLTSPSYLLLFQFVRRSYVAIEWWFLCLKLSSTGDRIWPSFQEKNSEVCYLISMGVTLQKTKIPTDSYAALDTEVYLQSCRPHKCMWKY